MPEPGRARRTPDGTSSSPGTASASSPPPRWPGVLTVEDAIALTAVRGRAMAAACAQTPTGMSAVLGGDPDEVLAAIDKHGLTPANMNGAGQIVAAGAARRAWRRSRPSRRPRRGSCRCRWPAPSTPTYMASAREELEGLVGGLRPADPSRLLLSNADGAAVDSGAEALSPTGQPGDQPGALRRAAWPPCASSASPPSSSCRRPARSPAWPSASGRAPASRSSRCPAPPTSTAPAS